jgi:hypothetical protein
MVPSKISDTRVIFHDWCAHRGSNPKPSAYEAAAPNHILRFSREKWGVYSDNEAELEPVAAATSALPVDRLSLMEVVALTGFEPMTSPL